jgi:hypothetical protein
MTKVLADRIREASVVPTAENLAQVEKAVSKLASSSKPALEDQLARLRLSFALDIDSDRVDRFDDQLADQGLRLSRRDDQLRSVLAALILIERYGRPVGARRAPSLALDTASALIARILMRTGATPVHPDVRSWGDYWLLALGTSLRQGKIPSAPSPPKGDDNAASAPEASADEAPVRDVSEEMRQFIDDLSAWANTLGQTRVGAHGEQLELMWWLMSAVPDVSPAELGARSAFELAAKTIVVPGPPNAAELLKRRLGASAEEKIEPAQAVEGIRERLRLVAPDEFTPLLSGKASLPEPISAHNLAVWAYDELLLNRLWSEAF